MPKPFLLSRVLMRFKSQSDDLIKELSAAAFTPDGSLWLGSDEYLSLERLSPVEPYIYGDHKSYAIADYLPLFDDKEEIDIEGMDYNNHYLWFTGSHSTKRHKPKGKKLEKDIQRLTEIETESNRFILGRIPVINGELFKSCNFPEDEKLLLTAACLQTTEETNVLMDKLANDEHLSRYIHAEIPSKENGFDVEGLAVRGNQVFLGLRGPVLRGWSIILELEIQETDTGVLIPKKVSDGRCYKKHFLFLNGLGIRELCWYGDELIILAGPTMDLEGAMQVFRWKNALNHPGDTLLNQESGELEVLFDLPFTIGSDHAEGLALFPCLGQPKSLLVVYDAPDPARVPEPNQIFADVFQVL